MLWSRLFIPTLRETPAGVEGVSQQLLVRAGYARQTNPGSWSYLFLGQRVLRKMERLAREEVEAIGGQEMLLPVTLPGAAPSEAVLISLATGGLRSYRQLPQVWYQIRTEMREERASKRVQQSVRLEAYWFGNEHEKRLQQAAARIFERCEVSTNAAEAGEPVQFVVSCKTGNEVVARCPECGYCANFDRAASRALPAEIADPEPDLEPESFATPDCKTIAEVAAFTALPATSQMKSLVLVADGKPVLALVRGDHALSEAKFSAALQAADVRPARADEIQSWFGAEPGSLGPVGVKNMRVIADRALQGRRNMIAGANRDGYHLRHVTPGEDFHPEFLDLRQVAAGDGCARCGAALNLVSCAELGSVSPIDSAGLHVLSADGQERPVTLVRLSIGIEPLLQAAIEAHHDCDGIALPASVAPFDVVVTPVNYSDASLGSASERIYASLREAGLDALLDDRDERPGVKFKDADLIGIPYRLTVGKKLAQGLVELMGRRNKSVEDIPAGCAAECVRARIKP